MSKFLSEVFPDVPDKGFGNVLADMDRRVWVGIGTITLAAMSDTAPEFPVDEYVKNPASIAGAALVVAGLIRTNKKLKQS